MCERGGGVDVVAAWKNDGGSAPPWIVIIINIFSLPKLP
jgi:hypothetical protein